MFGLNEMKTEKKNSNLNQENTKNIVNKLVDESIIYISKFNKSKGFDIDSLEKASYKLLKATELAPRDAELYVCLSYILYNLNLEEEGRKCIEIAQKLDPNSVLTSEFSKVSY